MSTDHKATKTPPKKQTAADISDLPDPTKPAQSASSLDAEEESQESATLPADVSEQIDRAKAWADKRNAQRPGAPPSHAFYMEVCGEHLIFTEPTLEQWERLMRTSMNEATKSKAGRQLVTDCIFWMRGQQKPGPAGALERLKEVCNFGGVRVMIMERAAGNLLDQMNQAAGDDVVKKR